MEKSKELIETRAELDVMKDKLKHTQTQLSKARKVSGADDSLPPNPPTEPTPPPVPEKKEEEHGDHPHVIKSWHPKYCPDSGCEARPLRELKNEVECSKCGISLGEEEDVKQPGFAKCPNCGKNKEDGGGYRKVR